MSSLMVSKHINIHWRSELAFATQARHSFLVRLGWDTGFHPNVRNWCLAVPLRKRKKEKKKERKRKKKKKEEKERRKRRRKKEERKSFRSIAHKSVRIQAEKWNQT